MCPSPSAVSGEGSVSVKQFTPTTLRVPASIARTRSAFDWTSRPLTSSIMEKAPPPSSTQSSSVVAAATSSSTFSVTTLEPSKRSPYSSRSLS